MFYGLAACLVAAVVWIAVLSRNLRSANEFASDCDAKCDQAAELIEQLEVELRLANQLIASMRRLPDYKWKQEFFSIGRRETISIFDIDWNEGPWLNVNGDIVSSPDQCHEPVLLPLRYVPQLANAIDRGSAVKFGLHGNLLVGVVESRTSKNCTVRVGDRTYEVNISMIMEVGPKIGDTVTAAAHFGKRIGVVKGFKLHCGQIVCILDVQGYTTEQWSRACKLVN